MAIAPLPPDYLTSPTAGGAISSAAARLFAEEGRRLAASIEEISLKNEAQAKAPALAAAYATGLSKLSQGDMSGFELLTKAEGESVGNPFLMQMTRSATSEGARMANSYIENQRSQTNILDRQMENQRAMFDRQASDDYRTSVQKIDTEYAEAYAKWQKDEAGRRRQAQIEGIQFTPTNPPEKPAYPQPPKPTSNAFGGSLPPSRGGAASTEMPSGGGTFDTGLMPGDTPMPGTPATADSVRGLVPEAAGNKNASQIYAKVAAGENAMTGRLMAGDEIVNEANAATGPVQTSIEGPEQGPLVNENWPAAPASGIELGKPRSPEVRGNEVVVPVGRMNVKVQVPPQSNMSVSETVNTSTGSKTYSIKGDKEGEDDASKYVQNIAGIAAMDHDLSEWIADQSQQKKKVTIEQVPGAGKDEPWIAKANGEPFGMENPAAATDPNAPATVARPVSAEVGKMWQEAQKAYPNIRGQVKFEYPPTTQQVTDMYSKQIDKINAGDATLEEVNKVNKAKGFKELTEKDLTSAKKEPIRSASPDIEAQLEKKGIKNPNKEGAPTPKAPKEVVRQLNDQIRDLKKQLVKDPSVYNRIIDLQEQINAIEKKEDEDTPSFDQFGVPTGRGIRRGLEKVARSLNPSPF